MARQAASRRGSAWGRGFHFQHLPHHGLLCRPNHIWTPRRPGGTSLSQKVGWGLPPQPGEPSCGDFGEPDECGHPPFRAVSPQTGAQNTHLSAKHLFPQGSSHSGETFCVFLKAMFRQCCSVASFRPDLVFKKRLALPSVPCGLLKTAICTDSEMPLHVGDKRDQP